MKLFTSLFRSKKKPAKDENQDEDDDYVEEWERKEEKIVKFDPKKIVSDRYIIFADEKLRNTLKSHIEILPNDTSNPKQIFQELINPSMYPFITGESYTTADIKIPDEIEEDLDHWGRLVENSKYQWLPSIYSINDKNQVKIKSYINNLNPNKYQDIYSDCEQVFEMILPYIEKCMHYAKHSYKDGFHESKKSEFVPIKGPREYQVITKASNYVLQPNGEFTGDWHIEGMTHEHILVSALYYYSTSPHLEDQGLSFRVEDDDCYIRAKKFGSVETLENRVIVFSNEFQHRVAHLKNTSPTEIASRKLLCFFVIDPSRPIVSTADVPYQQWDHRIERNIIVLLWVSKCIGVRLPKDIVLRVVEMAKVGFTKEEAMMHEIELNNERATFERAMNRQMSRNFLRTTIVMRPGDFD